MSTPIITSNSDGRMQTFQRYEDGGGIGFTGHERILFLSLRNALSRVDEMQRTYDAIMGKDVEVPDEINK